MKTLFVFFILLYLSCSTTSINQVEPKIIVEQTFVGMIGLKFEDINAGPWFIPTSSNSFKALYVFHDSIIEYLIQGTTDARFGTSGDTLGLIDVFKWKWNVHRTGEADSNGKIILVQRRDIPYCDNWNTCGCLYCDSGHSFMYTMFSGKQKTPTSIGETDVYSWSSLNNIVFYSQSDDTLILGYADPGTPAQSWPLDWYIFRKTEPLNIKGWKDIWNNK
jgi:hypothetical protein